MLERPISGLSIEPQHGDFAKLYDAGMPQVVWTKLVADLETPVAAYLKIAHGQPMSFLMESVEGGEARGRYSMIGLKPDIIWRARGENAEINRTPHRNFNAFRKEKRPTLASLRELLAESRIDLPAELPPMAAGIFGFMGYDTVRLVERLPNMPTDVLGVPDAVLMRPTVIIIFDALKDEMTLVTPVRPSGRQSADTAYRSARKRLSEVADSLATLPPPSTSTGLADLGTDEPVSNTSPGEYMAMVERAKDYIRAGDAFQIVLSQRFSAPFTLPPFALYRALRRTNPSPFLFFIDLGDFSLVGSSPEILVRSREGKVTIRPIAGTARRGATREEDQLLGEQLLADPKERAEHLMLLDLGRNDVGRVAEIGSVEVTESFTIERYSHVMHIVSNVVGDQRHDRDAIDALMAGFPAGTVSGAPKFRA
ncbi:MAG: anthranilate synthase, component chorismate binding, partial [Pseudomonadota bacterium]